MTKVQIRQLDVRVRQNMLANGQLTKAEVAEALKDRDDLPDLADKCLVSETPAPQEEESEEEGDQD